ncbi:MAG: class I SAM-dependent methyltransferase, partial [Pseudomonadota bacterium]
MSVTDTQPDRCPACHGRNYTLTASWQDWVDSCQHRPDGPMRIEAATLSGVAADAPDLLTCDTCGTVRMSQLPTPAQLGDFYQSYHGTGDYVSKAKKKIFRAQKRILWLSLFAPRNPSGGKKRFLELGASIGTAAEAARRLGYKAHAVEIDNSAVTTGRELFPQVTFTEGQIETLPPTPSYEMIYGAEIVEHVIDPEAFLKDIHDRLVPGGLAFMTTPDAGHKKRPTHLLDWKSVKP